jgi:hypothetical protein
MAALKELRHGSDRTRDHGRPRPIRRLTLLRAWWSGVIYSRGYSFDINDRPVVFALGFVVHVGIVVMRAAFAAGYSPDEVRRFALWSLTAGR